MRGMQAENEMPPSARGKVPVSAQWGEAWEQGHFEIQSAMGELALHPLHRCTCADRDSSLGMEEEPQEPGGHSVKMQGPKSVCLRDSAPSKVYPY